MVFYLKVSKSSKFLHRRNNDSTRKMADDYQSKQHIFGLIKDL